MIPLDMITDPTTWWPNNIKPNKIEAQVNIGKFHLVL